MLHVYTYAIHVILIISVGCNSFLVTNCNKKIMFFSLIPRGLPHSFLLCKKNFPNALEIVSLEIQP